MGMSGRGRGVTIGMTSRGGGVAIARGGASARGRGAPPGRMVAAGPRPSFQYRDGAFICDLCKKSFSDGNDMVAHWKSHVKQQQLQKRGGGGGGGFVERSARPAAAEGGIKRGRGRPPGRPAGVNKPAKTHVTSRGRPITSKQAGRKARKDKKAKRGQRKDKGKPRWTAYLLWSTRRRKEIKVHLTLFYFKQKNLNNKVSNFL